MDKKEKTEWVIKYIKRNELTDILNEKYFNKNHKPKSVIKSINNYSNLIQALCSVMTIILISTLTLKLTYDSNKISDRQAKVSEVQVQPIIDAEVSDGLDTSSKEISMININISNNGNPITKLSNEIIHYFDVQSNENYMGSVPIRIYLYEKDSPSVKLLNQQKDLLYKIKLRSCNDNLIKKLKDSFDKVPASFTKLAWGISYKNLIRINYNDILNNSLYSYFIVCDDEVTPISKTDGDLIYNEFNKMKKEDKSTWIGVEARYDINKITGEDLFKEALVKIRSSKKCRKEIEYGKYEPSK